MFNRVKHIKLVIFLIKIQILSTDKIVSSQSTAKIIA
jgi:hypothetical protein